MAPAKGSVVESAEEFPECLHYQCPLLVDSGRLAEVVQGRRPMFAGLEPRQTALWSTLEEVPGSESSGSSVVELQMQGAGCSLVEIPLCQVAKPYWRHALRADVSRSRPDSTGLKGSNSVD